MKQRILLLLVVSFLALVAVYQTNLSVQKNQPVKNPTIVHSVQEHLKASISRGPASIPVITEENIVSDNIKNTPSHLFDNHDHEDCLGSMENAAKAPIKESDEDREHSRMVYQHSLEQMYEEFTLLVRLENGDLVERSKLADDFEKDIRRMELSTETKEQIRIDEI